MVLRTVARGLVLCADGLLAVFAAPRCAACDVLLEHPTGGPVCGACWRAVARIAPPVCLRCGVPLPSWRAADVAAGRCARCRRYGGALDMARAHGTYDGSLRAILHAFKFDGRSSLARPLARAMRGSCADLLRGADAVVPVPLHVTREWNRGFNQADALASHLGLPVWRVLRRVRRTTSQSALGAGPRRRNVRGAFGLTACGAFPLAVRAAEAAWHAAGDIVAPNGGRAWRPSARASRHGRVPHAMRCLDDACVVLVDDVNTTGATLEECARVLKSAGAREVRAVTAARAVRARP